MNEKTIINLVAFIKSYAPITGVDITWYGGEPLMAMSKIKSILDEIGKSDITIIDQGMITNGYLLTNENQQFIIDNNITFVQITLDGDEHTHNMRRPHKTNHSGTWATILKNIDSFLAKKHNISISIRCNVDRENVADFINIRNFLKKRWNNDKRVSVYPGIITGDANTCSNGCSLMNNNNVANLYLELAKYDNEPVYFKFDSTTCGAGNINAFVVGSEGELYKCWNELGQSNRIVGYIDRNDNPNPYLLARYLGGSSLLDDNDCRKCPLFFVCDGGCQWKRIENKYNNTNYELCAFQKEHIDEFLELHYEQKLKKENNECVI